MLASRLVLSVALACVAGGCARSRTPQAHFAAAYANSDGANGARAGVGFDAAVARADAKGSGVRLGGRLSVAGFGGGGAVDTEFSPQALASYRHVFGDPVSGGAAFVEPGVGLGLAIFDREPTGSLDLGWDAGWVATPFLRGGLARGRYLVGVEAGYQHPASGDLDEEWYVGLFLAVPAGR